MGERRIENSAEGIPLVFGDGKYPHDQPRPASAFEIDLASSVADLEAENERLATIDFAQKQSRKDWANKAADLEAEVERLREALTRASTYLRYALNLEELEQNPLKHIEAAAATVGSALHPEPTEENG